MVMKLKDDQVEKNGPIFSWESQIFIDFTVTSYHKITSTHICASAGNIENPISPFVHSVGISKKSI